MYKPNYAYISPDFRTHQPLPSTSARLQTTLWFTVNAHNTPMVLTRKVQYSLGWFTNKIKYRYDATKKSQVEVSTIDVDGFDCKFVRYIVNLS